MVCTLKRKELSTLLWPAACCSPHVCHIALMMPAIHGAFTCSLLNLLGLGNGAPSNGSHGVPLKRRSMNVSTCAQSFTIEWVNTCLFSRQPYLARPVGSYLGRCLGAAEQPHQNPSFHPSGIKRSLFCLAQDADAFLGGHGQQVQRKAPGDHLINKGVNGHVGSWFDPAEISLDRACVTH